MIAKEKIFKKKYKKYTKILNRLTWFNACLSGISVATGISSVATFATFIGIPVSTALGAASMTGAIASGIISALTKRYQQTPELVIFERVVSGTLKNGVVDEEEFNMLQTLHLETLNELTGIDCRMEAEHRSLVEKSLLGEINEIKKFKELLACCAISCVTLNMDKIYYQPNHFWKGQKLLRSWQNLAERNLRQLNNGYLGKQFGKYIYQLLRALIDLITR